MSPYISISRPLIVRRIIFLASVASPLTHLQDDKRGNHRNVVRDKNHAPLAKCINPEYICKESSISSTTVMFKYLRERDNAGDKANETLAK